MAVKTATNRELSMETEACKSEAADAKEHSIRGHGFAPDGAFKAPRPYPYLQIRPSDRVHVAPLPPSEMAA